MSIVEFYQREELVGLVVELTERYSGFDSTSVTYERAQQLMEAVCCCLQMHQQLESDLPTGTNITVREAYQRGYEAVCNQARQVRLLYEQLLPRFQSYGMLCLQDTIVKGIPAFLVHYDARYCPQDRLLTMDYPVLTDLRSLRGVQAVWAYLRCIDLEQRFLSKLGYDFVCDSLWAYHSNYAVLIENICAIVLPGLLGYVLLEKPLHQRCFTKQDYRVLTNRYGAMEQSQLIEVVRSAVSRLTRWDGDVEQYLLQGAEDAAVRLSVAMETNTLQTVCLPCCEK